MIFEVRNGSFQYSKEKKLLRHIDFCLEKPQVVSVLGVNGIGKTTMLKCMLGLLPWSQGSTFLYGTDLKKMCYKKIWQNIGYVPQAKTSAFSYTVEDMVLLGRGSYLGAFGQPGKKDRKIAHECLELIGISHLKNKLCNQISGGELQMVLIARALAAKPSLLVLDEPESNLDFKNQMIVLSTIEKLCKEQQISTIVNTHYPEHAIAISQKALLLNQDGTSLFGDTAETLNEDNLRRAFGVNVKIKTMVFKEKKHTCVVPISLLS